MNKFLALFIALLAGGIAVILIYGYVDRTKKNVYKGMDMVPVLVASSNIPEGSTLQAGEVSLRPFPKKFLSQRVIHSKDAKTALGAITKVNIERGTPIYWSDLLDRSVITEGLSDLLLPGMTTYVLPVSDVTGVANMLQPGHRVDVNYSFDMEWLETPNHSASLNEEPQNIDDLKMYMMKEALGDQVKGGNSATALLYSNVLILSTDSNIGSALMTPNAPSDNEKYSTVTLMVTPHQSRILTFCSKSGELSLALRKNNETLKHKNIQMITRDVVLNTIVSLEQTGQKETESVEANEVIQP